MRKYLLIISAALVFVFGCKKDADFLQTDPTNVLTDEAVWKSEGLVLSVLADLYNRYVDQQTITNWVEFTNFDEAFPSQASEYWRVQQIDYPYGWWSMWDYGQMRDLNLFIQKCSAASALSEDARSRFLGEARFLRAALYFEMVKRMGGVPLITEPMTYNFSGDPTYLQHARAKESEVYDFIIAEMDTIKTMLPDDRGIQARATKGVALAMQARAALYAASIAKYGAGTPSVSTPGGEVGIPADKANAYYTKALAAAQELINGGKYALYQKKAEDLQDNFAATFYDKSNNPEVIFAQDFKLKSGKVQGWTIVNQPWSSAEEQQGGRVNPSLNLAEQYEKLDNTYAPFATNSGSDYIYYDKPGDIFAGRDARLGGTIMLPGSKFKGKDLDIWAGIMYWNNGAFSVISGDTYGEIGNIPGGPTGVQVVGTDGPIDGKEYSAQTGFLVRKFMDPTIGSGQLGTQSEVWWVRYRYAEVLLNAAEAAFELNQPAVAAGYMNTVRARAGLTTPLAATDITFDRIVHERKVELAFEGHELFDNKRWRLAHKVWNGESISASDVVSNIGKADKLSTQIYGLWPYKIYNPGNANNGKYVFKVVKSANVTASHRFNLGNYYSSISADILSNNPKLVKNPNQ
ncbi:RagB/SusD family nutrient uptake outer membrane protein [Chitinophaga sancti]|uniref:RagB/SusD family nutrient uptake outer membrane protein n=1 Tax=Chitinophaga sancti TaxID=1004 RepID=A0A1K1NSY8_9BACT|nr:RagB/SusD family nutrient uptake outer membrane protein [Chitinophaga sancti]WQD60105.1 RagB/SusD family nutrient uptake outer membrane protein [Chitinophaga sancti]WQG87767.1 RagB/SusD family nutrient uptake outer membrane protein [Chitinophaga sancti]SFW37534.1 Starch-binding associating with outer membrane [Chitinophaga sancti]